MNEVGILGIGTAVPPYTLDQSEAARFASLLSSHNEEQTRLVGVLYRRSSVRQRHLAFLDTQPHGGETAPELQSLFHETRPDAACRLGPTTAERMAYYAARSVPLAEQAARCALASAAVPASGITHLVTISCTGFVAPGVDIALITRLGLVPGRAGERRLHGLPRARSTGCASRGLRGPIRRCAGPALCRGAVRAALSLPAGTRTPIVANALFADGAAAAVLGRNRRRGAWRLSSNGAVPGARFGWTR